MQLGILYVVLFWYGNMVSNASVGYIQVAAASVMAMCFRFCTAECFRAQTILHDIGQSWPSLPVVCMLFLLLRRGGPGLSILRQALLARVPWSEGCALCGRDDNPNKTLICDRCDREIHMFCLEPKLKKVRAQTWKMNRSKNAQCGNHENTEQSNRKPAGC